MSGGVAVQQDTNCVAGAGLVQRPQQPGDGPWFVEAGVGGGPAGQGGDGVAGPGLVQLLQQGLDVPRVVDAGLGGGPLGGTHGVVGADVAQEGDKPGGGSRADSMSCPISNPVPVAVLLAHKLWSRYRRR